MNWLIFIIGTYLVIAWLIGLGFFLLTRNCLEKSALDTHKHIRWFSNSIIILLAPVWIPFVAVKMANCLSQARKVQGELISVLRQYRPPQFSPMDLEDPDHQAAQASFEEIHSMVEPLGMNCLDTFYNKTEPVQVFDRYYASQDSSVILNLTYVFEEITVAFESFLTDGHIVQTHRQDFGMEVPGFTIIVAEVDDLQSVLQKHILAVQETCRIRGVKPVEVDSDSLIGLVNYENEVFYYWKKSCGEIDNEVPNPIFPMRNQSHPGSTFDLAVVGFGHPDVSERATWMACEPSI